MRLDLPELVNYATEGALFFSSVTAVHRRCQRPLAKRFGTNQTPRTGLRCCGQTMLGVWVLIRPWKQRVVQRLRT